MNWTNTDEYLHGQTAGFKMRAKIAAFDLDSTLVTTKSGRKFPKGADDWKFAFDVVGTTLHQLANKKFSIIIISNQSGLNKQEKIQEWMSKLDQIANVLSIEMMVLAAIGKGGYRKPQTRFVTEFFPVTIDATSFYCGDAAGRDGDFSDTDYKFALNAKWSFKLPEHLFLNQANTLPSITYPIDFKSPPKALALAFTPVKKKEKKEMLIMVGYPASGKSTVSSLLHSAHGYTIVNKDTLKTQPKCIKAVTNAMAAGESLVIDCTNPSTAHRKVYIDLANSNNYKVRIVWMTTSLEVAQHNNQYRAAMQQTTPIPDIAYNVYKSNFEEPDVSTDGVDEVIKQEAGYPTDPLYYMYYG